MPPKMKPVNTLVAEPDEPGWYIFDGFRRNAAYDVIEERRIYKVESRYIDNMQSATLVVAGPRSDRYVLLRAFVGYWWKIEFTEPSP